MCGATPCELSVVIESLLNGESSEQKREEQRLVHLLSEEASDSDTEVEAHYARTRSRWQSHDDSS